MLLSNVTSICAAYVCRHKECFKKNVVIVEIKNGTIAHLATGIPVATWEVLNFPVLAIATTKLLRGQVVIFTDLCDPPSFLAFINFGFLFKVLRNKQYVAIYVVTTACTPSY